MDIDGYNGKLGSGNVLQLAMKHPIFQITTDPWKVDHQIMGIMMNHETQKGLFFFETLGIPMLWGYYDTKKKCRDDTQPGKR